MSAPSLPKVRCAKAGCPRPAVIGKLYCYPHALTESRKLFRQWRKDKSR